MRVEKVVTIAAPAETVWDVLTDLESWPEVTASVTSVERVDPGPLRIGSRVRIKQPRLPESEWTVTRLVDGQRFEWTSVSPGVTTTAVHALLDSAGATTLRLEIEQTGPLSVVAGLLGRRLVRRYLDQESQGIKERAESLA